MIGINDEIMLFSSTLVLRLLKMRFGMFKRPSCLIVKVCGHKCDLDRRHMNLNATKCTFGHSEITRRRQQKAEK